MPHLTELYCKKSQDNRILWMPVICTTFIAKLIRTRLKKQTRLIDGGAIASAWATIGITAAYRAKLLRLEFSCQKKRASATKKVDSPGWGDRKIASAVGISKTGTTTTGVEERGFAGWNQRVAELRESGARTVLS